MCRVYSVQHYLRIQLVREVLSLLTNLAAKLLDFCFHNSIYNIYIYIAPPNGADLDMDEIRHMKYFICCVESAACVAAACVAAACVLLLYSV